MKLWWKLHEKRLGKATTEYLCSLQQDGHQERAERLLTSLRGNPRVNLGTTQWGSPVEIPLPELTTGHGVVTGGTGSGKSMLALLVIQAMVQNGLPFGLIDAKGELFERTLYLLTRHPELYERVVVVDFSNREAITSYNILAPQGDDFDFFVTSRVETLKELLPSQDRLSLRGAGILRNAVTLLAETGETLLSLDRLLAEPRFRSRLLRKSKNHEVKAYFQWFFPEEARSSVAAVRSRMATLFGSDGVRSSLSGSTAPDFRRLQDDKKIVLINCAGPSISRGVRLLLQGLVLSDIRQSVFARETKTPFPWLLDEAQNLFLTHQQAEEVSELLWMGRSFGAYLALICQNLSSAIQDPSIQETLFTNIRWSFSLRSTPKDAAFLRSVLPVTGHAVKPTKPFQEKQYYTETEERNLLHEGIAHLPDRVGYLWLKARSPEAVKVKTRSLALPPNFQEIASGLRDEPEFGQRISRAEYERLLRAREIKEPDMEKELERNYRA